MNEANARGRLETWLWGAPVAALICVAASWAHFFLTGGLRLQQWPLEKVLVRCDLAAVLGLLLLGACCAGAYRSAKAKDLKSLLTSAVLVHICMALALPLFSTDLFTYLAYGEIAARGMDPHLVGPIALGDSPIVQLANWPTTPSAYGPAADKLMAIAGQIGFWFHSQIWVPGVCYKLMASSLDLWSIFIMYGMARDAADDDRARGFALFGLNPVLAWEVAGQGHNDGMVVLAAVCFIWCTLHQREALGIAALTLGMLSKFVLAPILALQFWQLLRRDWRLALKLSPVPLLTAAVIYAPHWSKSSILNPWLRPLHQDAFFQSGGSMYTLFWKIARAANGGLPPSPVTYTVYAWVGRLLLITLAVFCIRRTRTARDVIFSALVLFICVLSTTAVVAPWYYTWLLPFVCMQNDRRWQKLVLGLTVVVAVSLGARGLWVVVPACQIAGILAILRWSWSGLEAAAPASLTPLPSRE